MPIAQGKAAKTKKAPSAKAEKRKFIVRPGFHVLIEDPSGRNRSTFSQGDTCELTATEYRRIKHQVEPWTKEAEDRILVALEPSDEPEGFEDETFEDQPPTEDKK